MIYTAASFTTVQAKNFLTESNRIEDITGYTQPEYREFNRFMALKAVTIYELEQFVKVYEPTAKLRDQTGLNVQVGGYTPPPGGVTLRAQLFELLDESDKLGPYETHVRYEKLHPFTDCNGRSGRMLWAWQCRDLSKGFLLWWYYETLKLKSM